MQDLGPDAAGRAADLPALRLTAALLAVLSGYLYWSTLHPGVGPYLDSIQYQITTLVMGVSHPPGYPLYTGLGALFVRIVPFGNPAFRLNLLSAAASVVTVLLIQRVGYRLTHSVTASTLGALSLAVAVRFWYQATYTELYPLYNTLVAATLLALLRYSDTSAPRDYFLAVALYALCFGVNVPAIVLLPMVLWSVLSTDWRYVLRPRTLALSALIVAAVAAQYLYVPLRAFAEPPARFCNYCPSTWAEVVDFWLGKQWWGISFGLPARYWLQRWADSGYQMMLQYWPVGVMVGGVGVLALIERRWRSAVTLLLGLAGAWIFVVTYDVVDWSDFVTPVVVLFAPLIAVGAHRIWLGFRRGAGAWSGLRLFRAAGLLCAALWFALVVANNWPIADQSAKTDWHGWARDLLPQMEEDAWLLTPPTATDGFVQTWVLRYISWAEELRPDLTVVYEPSGAFDPPGPAPYYLPWVDAEPHLRDHAVYLIELNDPRVAGWALVPVRRYDGWIIGYRVVGERTADGIDPWVDAATWAELADQVVSP